MKFYLFLLFILIISFSTYGQDRYIDIRIEPLFGAPLYGEAYWYRSNDIIINNNTYDTSTHRDIPISTSMFLFKPMTKEELDSLHVKVIIKYNALKTEK